MKNLTGDRLLTLMSSLKAKIALSKHRLTTVQKHGLILTLSLVLLGLVIGASYMFVYTQLKNTKIVYIDNVQAKVVGEVVEQSTVAHAPVENEVGTSQEEQAFQETTPLHSLILETFNSQVAVKIAQAESGLNPNSESNCDITADGHSFSIGLMQLNLTQHKIGDVDCTKAFSGKNYKATVIDHNLYQKCVKLAKNPAINLATAKKIYDNQGWEAWGAFNDSMLTTE